MRRTAWRSAKVMGRLGGAVCAEAGAARVVAASVRRRARRMGEVYAVRETQIPFGNDKRKATAKSLDAKCAKLARSFAK